MGPASGPVGSPPAGGRILDSVLKVIGALIPSAGLLLLFWMALRAIVQADRRERAAEAKWNRAHGVTTADAMAGGGSSDVSVDASRTGETGHAPSTASSAEAAGGDGGSGPA